MRFARKLALPAVTVVALITISAGPASAVTVNQETNPPQPCPALVAGDHVYTGGCLLTMASPAGNPTALRAIFGAMFLCDWTLTARVNGNGEGFVYNQLLRTPGTANPCTVQPQLEADGHAKPWPFEILTENGCGAGCDSAELVFSVTGPFGIIVNCHLTGLELRQSSHTAAQLRTPGTIHKFCENDPHNAILGMWNVTSPAPGIEVG